MNFKEKVDVRWPSQRGFVFRVATRILVALCAGGLSAYATQNDPLAPTIGTSQPPPPDESPFSETLYGTKIDDPYRQLELLSSTTQTWIKAQGKYTRNVLDAIVPRKALYEKVARFGDHFTAVQQYQHRADRDFFEERISDNFDLMVRDNRGTRTLVDVAALRATHGGKPYTIDYYLASPDGTKVAVGISEGGTEDASLTVIDTISGRTIGGPVDRAQFGLQTWSSDGKRLYFNRLKLLSAGDAQTNKYNGSTVDEWDMKSTPRPILGIGLPNSPITTPSETPQLTIVPTAPLAIAQSTNGAQPELSLWSTATRNLSSREIPWKQLVTRSDGIIAFAMRGPNIYLLSHKRAPNFKVLKMKAGDSLANATTVLPESKHGVVESIGSAADALYAVLQEGVYSHLLRVSDSNEPAEEITLPFKGYISETFAAPRKRGVTIIMESWTHPPGEYVYDPNKHRLSDLKLARPLSFDLRAFSVADMNAITHDETRIPLTLIRKRDFHSKITVLSAYGSYGISFTPAFSRILVMVQMGGNWAVCHVRGGGELGEAWRLGGKDVRKPNTWRDLIACAEDLIARGVTTKDKLFLWGGSAGGIAVGRAMTDRPDLFAGVIDDVPAANMTRLEFSPDGPLETAEFGTIRTEQGFRNLLEMDTYQHIRKGARYPAILITMGLNDPRIAPWIPAKLAARMLSSGTSNPVLLRVQDDQGHGVNLTKSQGDEYFTDMISFMFWRAGLADWQPHLKQ